MAGYCKTQTEEVQMRDHNRGEGVDDYMRTHAFGRNLQHDFFEALLAGYVGEGKFEPVHGMPGTESFTWKPEGSMSKHSKVVDMYTVSPFSSYSSGSTTIYYEDQPVWTMQYFGFYDEEAIPCLKDALRKAYEQEQFFGGRGPESFHYKGFNYVNYIEHSDFFGTSYGHEKIYNRYGKFLGYHRYHSEYLIKYLRHKTSD